MSDDPIDAPTGPGDPIEDEVRRTLAAAAPDDTGVEAGLSDLRLVLDGSAPLPLAPARSWSSGRRLLLVAAVVVVLVGLAGVAVASRGDGGSSKIATEPAPQASATTTDAPQQTVSTTGPDAVSTTAAVTTTLVGPATTTTEAGPPTTTAPAPPVTTTTEAPVFAPVLPRPEDLTVAPLLARGCDDTVTQEDLPEAWGTLACFTPGPAVLDGTAFYRAETVEHRTGWSVRAQVRPEFVDRMRQLHEDCVATVPSCPETDEYGSGHGMIVFLIDDLAMRMAVASTPAPTMFEFSVPKATEAGAQAWVDALNAG